MSFLFSLCSHQCRPNHSLHFFLVLHTGFTFAQELVPDATSELKFPNLELGDAICSLAICLLEPPTLQRLEHGSPQWGRRGGKQ